MRRWLLGCAALFALVMTAPAGPTRAAASGPAPTADTPSADTAGELTPAAGPAAEPTPTDEPTATSSPDPPSSPPTPDPLAGIAVRTGDLALGGGYWSGAANTGDITISVTNTGQAREDASVTYTLPNGVRQTGVSTTCNGSGQTYACVLGIGKSTEITVHLAVDPTAWRTAPLHGSVAARGSIKGRPDLPPAYAQGGFSVVLPPGPPTPGITLTAVDLTLPAQPSENEVAQLTVRFANTGSVPATAALDVVTPEGTDLAAVPPDCTSRRRVATHRDRCDLGKLDAGRDRTLTFTLSVSPAGRAQAPLSGAVYGYLTPSGQDTATVQTGYRITVSSDPGQLPAATAVPGASGTNLAAPAVRAEPPVRPAGQPLTSRPLSVLSIIGSIVGLMALAGVFAVLSLRRRMRDDLLPPPGDPVRPSGDPIRGGVEPRGAATT
jgi:hypothetical protein